MRGLILFLSFFSSVVSAETFLRLPLPPPLANVGQSGTKSCIGTSFNADSSISGFCRTKNSSPCSGRGCQPVTFTTTYVTIWDAEGNFVSEVTCGIGRHHLPQADTVTYAAGYDATSCPLVNRPQNISFTINGTPYYYWTTDAASGAVLVSDNYPWGFLYSP